MLQHPLLPLTLAYTAGVLVSAQWPVPLLPGFGLAFLAGLGALVARKGRTVILVAFLFFTGAVNLASRTVVVSPFDLRSVAGMHPTLGTISGRLEATPTLRLRSDGESFRSLAVVAVESIETGSTARPALGRVAVSTPAVLPEGFYGGRRVRVFGVLRLPGFPRAPGLFDARAYFHWQGIEYQFEAQGTNDWALAPDPGPPPARPLADRFIAWAQAALRRGLPVEDEPLRLMWAMTLGWRTALTDEVAAPFMHSGTMHVFAISGLHIVLIAGILVTVLRVARVPRKHAAWAVVPALWFYTAATGWQPSAVRSTVMMTVVVGGWVLKRPVNLLNSLAGAGLILLVWEPRQLFQAGFQLSFFVVLSMALLLPPLESWRERVLRGDPLRPPELQPWWRRRLDGPIHDLSLNLAVSASAWIGSLPVVAQHFNLVTPVSLLANLVVVPLSGLVLTSNLASLCCATWFPSLSEVFNHAGWFGMRLMVAVSEWCARLPGAFFHVRAPGWIEIGAYYGVMVAVARDWFRRPWWRLAGCSLVALGAGVPVTRWLQDRGVSTLLVLALQGGHAVWVDPPGRGKEVLVDCGDLTRGAGIVVPFLHAQGWDRLPNLVLTHGDIRHVGGAVCLDSNVPPRRIWVSGVPFRSAAYRDYLACQSRDRVQRVNPKERAAGWRVLYPGASRPFSLADDNALVLRQHLGGLSVLLLSDLARAGAGALLEQVAELQSDLVITGLPSRGEPLPPELLERIQPRLIVVADDEHPATARASRRLKERLRASGCRVVFTSELAQPFVKLRLKAGREPELVLQTLATNEPLVASEPQAPPGDPEDP